MFYSQFILAKKGPLGTIWIAAHLERKLKKNQVADTDIGDSVDSILSPDVPIALRLSSHLLLGVVRIYSRKVNYLFHDCSETLLKVKQALCSTTVDLPPEESTAPYHSITLPETFDLDDFELPDSAALNGNLDDRHVSSREQITLQNTLDGTEYSISQFELDERFGDGDVSQIGLDLDEELMLDNNLKHQHDPVSYGDAHKGEGTGDLTKMDIDEAQLGGDEDRNNEASRELSELLCNDHGKHVISDDAHKGEGASDLARMDIDEPQLVGDEERNNEASTELSELLCNDQGKHVISDHAFKGEGANDLAKVDIDEAQLGGADDRNKEVSTELSELLCNDRGKHVISDVQNANRIDDSSHRLVFSIRTPDLNEVSLPDDHIDDPIGGPSAAPNIGMDFAAAALPSLEFDEFANIPSMPILANCQKLPSSNPQEILPYTTDLANGKLDKPINQEIECPDATNKNLVNTSLTNRKLDNIAQAVSSPTSNLDEPKSVAPQCSGGIFPSLNPLKEVHHIHNDSIDATNSGNRVSSESTDPKLSEVSRLLPSSTSVLPEAVSVSQVPRCSDGTVDTPGWVGLESTLRTINNSDAGIVWNEADTVPLSVDNGIPYEDTSRLSNLDQRRVEEANSYQTNDFSVLSSDFQMRSCTSVSNQANLTIPGDMLLKKTPGFSSRDQPCNLETPAVDQELYFSGSSLGQPVFFAGFPSVAIDNNFRSHQKSNYIQLGHPNCFSSSKFSEPERMLYAPSGNFNLSSDFGLQTIEKVVVESDGSVDRISNLHGKKRRLLDNTPESQNGISPNMSGIPPKKRNNDYNDYIIHKEDDLLASILDGRRTPALKIGPTPPLPKPPSSKRPRLTQKVCLPKRRKVLLDDATVVHAEAIRQQLMNTEDIRRMRRTAPCARPEIWRIQKSFTVEDDIFCESIFLGISDELSSLPRRYDPVQNMHAQANGQHSSGEAIKEFEVSKSSPLVRDDDGREITVHTAVVTKSVHGEIRGASGGELIGAESCLIDVSVDAHEQIESTFVVPFDSKIEENRNDRLADVEHNSLSREFRTSQEAEVNDTALDTATYVSFKEFTSAVTDGASVKVQDLSNAKASSISVEHMGADVVNVTNLECPQEEQAGMIKDHSYGASTSMLDKFVVEVSADFPDSSTVIEHVGSVCGDAVVDGKRAASEDTCGEMPNVVSFPVPPSTEGERAPSPVGENSCMNAEGGLDVESTPVELASTRESSDFCCAVDNIDTDFLNVDDEDAVYDEETINDAPHTEAAQSLENSGWSSRTRGVARYLRTVFDQESGRARKFVAVDHLLAGKTRKEASRMFFETLVLKTRDYIHVEQDDPFSCINIKPRINLLKTEF